ncbi:MAG: hypothetical protein GY853_06040 [PVC group bacterium]|nr:hypothetical protein [PVC group bacterium]
MTVEEEIKCLALHISNLIARIECAEDPEMVFSEREELDELWEKQEQIKRRYVNAER